MSIRFDHPEWLWGLALLPVLAGALLAWGGSMSLPRRWTAIVLRAGLLALLLAMLAGVTAVRTTSKLAVVAVVDTSLSVRSYAPSGRGPDGEMIAPVESVRRWLMAASAKRGPEDLLGVVAFDGSAAVLTLPTAGDALQHPIELQPTDGTNLGEAIRLAVAAFPRDATRRMVVISDGVATAGDARAAAREASGVRDRGAAGGPAGKAAGKADGAADGGTGGGGSARPAVPGLDRIVIDVLPLRYEVAHEVMVESVDAPTRAQAGATVSVRVALSSSGPATGVLRLYHEGEEVDLSGGGGGAGSGAGDGLRGRRVELSEGRKVVVVNVPLGGSRVHRFRAVFEPDGPAPGQPAGDTIAANNIGEAVTITPGKGAVLIVEGVRSIDNTGDAGATSPARGLPGAPGGPLARMLREEGFEVEVVGPESFPADLLRLQAYDLVFLQDVAADALGTASMERLARFVTELGGGLCMLGGPESFAAGGYKGSPLEPILPVRLDLPEKLVLPAAAVMIVLDCSGSMGWRVQGSSRTQQEIANEGAALAARSLDKNDLLGVISFSSDYTVEIPLAKNADPIKAAKTILSIRPDGGTNIPPALQEAYRQMRGAQAKVKHVILLTDGVSQGKSKLDALCRAMAEEGIKVSTIAVGDGADGDGLASMAKAGGGQFYQVLDPYVLPKVFLRAIRVVRTPLYREGPFIPVTADSASPLLDGYLASGPPPALLGLNLAQVRPEITALNPLLTDKGEPVLAHWQAGLGQVAAFTSDAGRWGEPWLDWPGYRALWTRVVRQVSRAPGSREAELSAEVVGDQLRIRVDAAGEDGRPLDGLEAPAAVYGPDGRRLEAVLSQIGPGTYEGVVRADQSGSYVVTVSPRETTRGKPRAMTPAIGGVTKPAGSELRVRRSNDRVLQELAELTGGRVLDMAQPEAAGLFDRAGLRPREARTPLWPFLLPWALVLTLVDIAVRRIAWDRLLSSRFGEGLRRMAARAVRDRSREAAATIGALREVEQQVEARNASVDGARLTAADARKIVEARNRELLAAQRAGLRGRKAGAVGSGGGGGGGGSSVKSSGPAEPTQPRPAPQSPGDAPPAGAAGAEEGLLAAKRRAREKFERS